MQPKEQRVQAAVNDFDCLADVYDELVAWAPYEDWVRDLVSRLTRWGLRRADLVLDAACGTGLSSIPLARAGYRVVGVDCSEAMLGYARAKAHGAALNVQFVRGSLAELDLPLTFDAAVCMHSGLDYILDLDELARVFCSLRRQLRAGGLLAFDKCLDEPGFYQEPRTDTRKLSRGTVVFSYFWDRQRKLFDQRCTVEREGPDGRLWRTEVLHRMLAVEPKKLVEMVEAAGFETLEPLRSFTALDPGMGIFRAV
jgi:SAM-dependent methyltransferase